MDINYGVLIPELLKKVRCSFDKNIRNYFCGCGLTIPQLKVLSILMQNSEMRISDISTEASLTNSTTSGIIDRLEKMGLVKRMRQDSDRRVVKVILTQRAIEYSYNLDLMMDNYFADLFSNVPEEDLKAIVKGLEIFNRIMGDEKCNP